jgi:hypothetical protein
VAVERGLSTLPKEVKEKFLWPVESQAILPVHIIREELPTALPP